MASSDSEFTRGGAQFTVELFRKLNAATAKENIIISPFSIQACMALAFTGAKGETAKEIATGMKYQSNSSSVVAKEFQIVLNSYNTGDLLKIANKIYVQHGESIKADYASITKEQYHAESETLNFAESELAAKTINSWVEKKTGGKIKDLVSSDSVDASTSLVLLNAIHFKGLWKEKFDQEFTKEGDFWISKDVSVKIEFMWQQANFNFAYLDDYKCMAVELPYKDSDLSMFVVMPFERDGLKELAKQLKDANLVELASELKNSEVVVRLPKFKIEYSVEVSKVLQEMGITKAFSCAADFSNILESAERIHISKVIHKAAIEVNEVGTEASAATCMPMGRCLPPEFVADHPFFYWIWNRKNVMFAGAFVNAPAKA